MFTKKFSNAQNTTSNLKKTLDTHHKTLYVVTYIKHPSYLGHCNCYLFMCTTSRTTSSNSEFLGGEIS